MMSHLYPALKHSHMLFVLLSFVLFNLRYWRRAACPGKALPLPWRIVPHVNDSLLLLSGILMMAAAPWEPFGAHGWLGVKLVSVLVYIVLGIAVMKSVPRSGKAYGAYALAMLAFAAAAYLARIKPI